MMRISSIVLFASTATAFSLPDISSILPLFARDGGSSCPSVWNDVSREFTSKFLTNGQCNPDARAAIRLIFHDCGSWNKAQGAKGGCDGSLILAGELARGENKGLQGIADYIQGRAIFYKVPVADMIGTILHISRLPLYHSTNTNSSLRREPRNRNLPRRPRRQDVRRPQGFVNTCARWSLTRRQRRRLISLQALPRQRLQRSRSRRPPRRTLHFQPIQLQHLMQWGPSGQYSGCLGRQVLWRDHQGRESGGQHADSDSAK
jgi:hypothetical protein